tara:strand:- start:523 stop:750 length:228 start_codon:yes stop_codon:yes gene_type:complete
MKYVLAHECQHDTHKKEDDGGSCDSPAYLHEEGDSGEKVVKVFASKSDALDFMRENRWSPDHIMVIPYTEGIFDE